MDEMNPQRINDENLEPLSLAKPLPGEADLAENVQTAYGLIEDRVNLNTQGILQAQEELDQLDDDLTNRVSALEADLHNQEDPPYADKWHKHAYADTAGKLAPGTTINGIAFNGSSPIALTIDDIGDSSRVFYGTSEPGQMTFGKALREGDLYVQVYW